MRWYRQPSNSWSKVWGYFHSYQFCLLYFDFSQQIVHVCLEGTPYSNRNIDGKFDMEDELLVLNWFKFVYELLRTSEVLMLSVVST